MRSSFPVATCVMDMPPNSFLLKEDDICVRGEAVYGLFEKLTIW